jgi:hypothetical protein
MFTIEISFQNGKLVFTVVYLSKMRSIMVSTKNEEIKILFSEFYRKANLETLLISDLGSKNKNALQITKETWVAFSFLIQIARPVH